MWLFAAIVVLFALGPVALNKIRSVQRKPPAGRAAAFRVTSVDRSDEAFWDMEAPDKRFSLASTPEDDVAVEELLKMPNAVPFALATPLSLERIIFVEIDDLAAVWAKPFLDRAIPQHAGRRAWVISLSDLERWAAAQPARSIVWIWNTGRCGSTLLHSLLRNAGVASVSESCWMDQLALATAMSDAVIERFLRVSVALDVHVASRVFPAATTFTMKPKGYGIRILDLVARTYPDDKMMYMYRAVDKIVLSFWRCVPMPAFWRTILNAKIMQPILGLLAGLFDRPPSSQELQKLKADGRLPAVDNQFAESIAVSTLDGVAKWSEADLANRSTLALRYEELSTKDESLRRRVVERLLAWITGAAPDSGQLDAAMEAFSEDSQAGSAMSRLNQTAPPDLPEGVMAQIRAMAAAVPSAGRADFVVPGSLSVDAE